MVKDENKGNGWDEWKNFVLQELKRLNICLVDVQKSSEPSNETLHADLKEVIKTVGKINVEVGMLKVKAGIWGLIGGLIPTLIVVALFIIQASS